MNSVVVEASARRVDDSKSKNTSVRMDLLASPIESILRFDDGMK